MKALLLLAAFALMPLSVPVAANVSADQELETAFKSQVRPFMDQYCASCHGAEEQKGDFDLTPYASVGDVVNDFKSWEMILELVETEEMPSSKAKKQPTAEERTAFISWIQGIRANEAKKNAGDPGPVLARRLSNAEYDYTIHDLTGVDIRPTKEFPVDPANQAGFDNTGESLAMSPALLNKYLDAARRVADHLVLKPDGMAFAPHPVVADTDRDKYSVLRIIEFYQRQPTDYAGYFMSAWRFKHRKNLNLSAASLADVAAHDGVSAKYLEKIWTALEAQQEQVGPLANLQAMWKDMPAPVNGSTAPRPAVQQRCEEMRGYVVSLRRKLVPQVKNLRGRPIVPGSQVFAMTKNRAMAQNRLRLNESALKTREMVAQETAALAALAAAPATPEAPRRPVDPNQITPDVVQRGGKFLEAAIPTRGSLTTLGNVSQKPAIDDPELLLPDDVEVQAQLKDAFARFAALFPDAFYITERARVYLDAKDEQDNGGRLLSAGLHSMTGYFRDDGPLYDLILDDAGKRELDRLWDEFNFYANIPARMHTSFVWFERTDSSFMRDPEFDPYRPENKAVTTQEKIKGLWVVYRKKAEANAATEEVLKAIDDHFAHVAANNLWLERTHEAAVPAHLSALHAFAARAYRRPVSDREREDLTAFYWSSRNENGLPHEDAMRDSIARVLMSPHFSYRIDAADALVAEPSSSANNVVTVGLRTGDSGADPAHHAQSAKYQRQPLSNYALASRLSYFLWASMPDEELLELAAEGVLQDPAVLAAQARRMLQNPRVRNLATEFVGHWLDFRRFEEHNAVDRERYPSFDDDLRSAMFEEPIRFFMSVVQEGGSVQDLLFGDYAVVNAPLAQHYGIEGTFQKDTWQRVPDVERLGRGGFLGMAVFMTANSPGLRTSPVKRGHWVVSRLLGEYIPPPPPDVPVLPSDEKEMGELTLRETLEKHRADPSCASCHARFDSYGLAFEAYGATGERRTLDFGGRPVDARAEFPGGVTAEGFPGLKKYVQERRAEDFIDNLSRKLLSYGLGRTLLLSDDALLAEMKTRLAADEYRFRALVETIVTSPQFMTKRVSKTTSTHAASAR